MGGAAGGLGCLLRLLERAEADPADDAVLDAGADLAVADLVAGLGPDDGDARMLAGWFYWYRYKAVNGGAERDIDAAAAVLGPVFRSRPEAVPDGLHARVLLIGFGRFGQIATQPLLARQHQLSIIDNDTDMIRAAAQFGMKVYYGDGTRLDILRSAGAGTADMPRASAIASTAVTTPAATPTVRGAHSRLNQRRSNHVRGVRSRQIRAIAPRRTGISIQR